MFKFKLFKTKKDNKIFKLIEFLILLIWPMVYGIYKSLTSITTIGLTYSSLKYIDENDLKSLISSLLLLGIIELLIYSIINILNYILYTYPQKNILLASAIIEFVLGIILTFITSNYSLIFIAPSILAFTYYFDIKYMEN